MTHFAAPAGLFLPVKMDAGAFHVQILLKIVYVISNQVYHLRIRMPAYRGHRQAANGAHMLFELGHRAGVNAPVPGIMRARRDFIGQKAPVFGDKQL